MSEFDAEGPIPLIPRYQTEALVAELNRRGLTAVRLTTVAYDRHPCIKITSEQMTHVAVPAYVYTAADDDGVLWFWGESLEPIAPAIYVSVAADIIAAQISLRRLQIYQVRAI